jgi:2-keto-4-pentenoate hydratase
VIDLTDMLALRAQRLAAGEKPIGWKVGFGSPPMLEKLGIDRPVIGFMTDRNLLPDGATVDIGGWTGPAFEAEIAVHFGRDGEIAGLSTAIEVADVDFTPEDAARMMAANVFHRHVILGPVMQADPDAVTGRVLRHGEEIAANNHPAELTGRVEDVVRLTAEALAAHGEGFRDGEVLITGSIVPPQPLEPGQRLTAELNPLGSLTVVTAAS